MRARYSTGKCQWFRLWGKILLSAVQLDWKSVNTALFHLVVLSTLIMM